MSVNAESVPLPDVAREAVHMLIPAADAKLQTLQLGRSEAERAAIFEPCYRSEGTADAPGVGLGLAISHALVRQMGGELDLESEVGTGSTFLLRLPLLGEAVGGPTR